MPPARLPFSLEEYKDRLVRVRSAMEKSGIEVLFTCDPSNMAWLTGYDGWSFYVHQGVLIGPDGEPIFWGRKMDTMGALRTCYMSPDNMVPYSDDYVMSTECHAMETLGNLIADCGWGSKKLGVEMENYYYSARAHEVLMARHEGRIIDVTALVNWCRAVKSEAEIGFMTRAARIVEKMHARIFEVMEPRRRKNEVVAEILHSAIWGAEDDAGAFGGDYAAIAPLLPTGQDASAAHLTWDDTAFETGAGTFFEIAGVYRRYHCPLCRTIYLGKPPDDMKRAEEAVLEGTEAAITAAAHGNSAGDVARAFYLILEKFGIERDGRCGYPIGLSYPPDWGERTFSIRQTDDTILKPNMTFHFMPALWMETWGLEITETLKIAETGPAIPLADYPRKLFVK